MQIFILVKNYNDYRKRAKIEAVLKVTRFDDEEKKTKLQINFRTRNSNDEFNDINSNNITMKSSNCIARYYNEEIHNINSIVYNEKKDESKYASNKRLYDEEYIKLKKELKEHGTHTYIPSFAFNIAVMDIKNVGKTVAIFLNDMQHFSLYLATFF